MSERIFIITGIVVTIYLLVVIYGIFLKGRERFRLRRIKKQPIALSYIENQSTAEKERTRDSLFGFLFSDIVLYGSNFVLAVAVLSSNSLAWDTAVVNKNANIEFELRTRPYVIIDNVEGKTDFGTKKSDFRIFIKNTGNMPAQVTRQTMDCVAEVRSPSIVKDDIIGSNQSFVYAIQFKKIEEATCVLHLKYRSALESFSYTEYETQQKFIYKFGEPLHSGGGFMK